MLAMRANQARGEKMRIKDFESSEELQAYAESLQLWRAAMRKVPKISVPRQSEHWPDDGLEMVND